LANYRRVVFQISINGKPKEKYSIAELHDATLTELPAIANVVVHKLAVVTEENARNVDFKHTFISTSRQDIINRLTAVAQKYELQ